MNPQIQHLDMMDHIVKKGAFAEGGSFAEWQNEGRKKLRELLGMDTFEKVEPDVRVEWTKQHDGFSETRFLYKTEKNYSAPAHLLIPDMPMNKKPPVMICLQGHSKGMHISLGRAIYPGDEEIIASGDRDFAMQAVKRGFAALTIEQRGFGESGGTEKGPACQQPAMAALLLGRTLIAERVWDVSRAIDVLETHFPQVDSERIGIMGNSGGGTATFYTMALETRIGAAMPSCAFCTYKDSIGEILHCVCNYIPGIMNWFDMGETAGLSAPRPMVIVSGLKDDIFPVEEAKEQFTVAQKLYTACGAEDKVRHVIGPEGHRFYADLAWPVFSELTGW